MKQDGMSATNEFREYENGIADVLASIVGDSGVVRRNIKLPSRSGGRARQIDVLVEGNIFGLINARMIVDCKRWKKAIDVADVETFIGTVEDVVADMGILVSAAGASDGAAKRAQAARGVRITAVSVDELTGWRPAGTVFRTIEIPLPSLEKATRALREAGLRVTVHDADDEVVRIEIFRHHGTVNPSGEMQQAQHQLTDVTLDKLSISHRTLNQGFVLTGGSPNHRWLQVCANGAPFVKVMVSTEAELVDQLNRLTRLFGVPVELLTVERPDDWPFARTFPF